MDTFDVALLILRLAVGGILAAHGFHKIFLGAGLSGNGAWFDGLGMRPGQVHARFAAFTEITAGIAMMLGIFTTIAAAAFVAVMLVAGWIVHRAKGFFIMAAGWEYAMLIAVSAVAIAMLGSGSLSVEQLVFGDNILTGWSGLVVAAGAGIIGGVGQMLLFYRPSRVVAA
ncbi:DoxX family protein [Rhodococcus ruber]|uniref:DoxX family protein n=1 Tax=Rhodococcus ruber TaxID=1830 RepID=A0ABT4MF34_9NOCA|nr:DoxX family protein [Rhodococcus ruber]MCZ4519438.1 DoxX family protein [Rhodococcus ruber]